MSHFVQTSRTPPFTVALSQAWMLLRDRFSDPLIRSSLYCGGPGEANSLVLIDGRSVAGPLVAEAGVVSDVLELGIDTTEFRANALDERAGICAITLAAVTGGEALAMDDIVNLAIGNGLARTRCQQRDNLELCQRQVDQRPGPARPASVKAQLKTAKM
jgi:hypothetical protein